MILRGISQPVVWTACNVPAKDNQVFWHIVSHGMRLHAGWIAELAALH
jgi:hypothetical protein